MTTRLFIFGAGYSGKAIARALRSEAASIAGTTREAEKAEALAASGIHPLLYAGAGIGEEIRAALAETTHLVQSIAPGEAGDPVLADLGDAFIETMPLLRWIGLLSTVGVYGDHGCEWVTEESECRPASRRSHWRLAAEAAWAERCRAAGLPLAIMRLSGIYGPGRNAFANLAAGKARRIIKPGQVFNRIHVDDVAGAARHLLRAEASGIYNVTDDEPAPPQDVVTYAAKLMGVEPPAEIPFDHADMSPMARSFYGECKRVSNARLKATGYTLRHAGYRQALESMWALGDWRGTPSPARRVRRS